jgi:hypothetical protein
MVGRTACHSGKPSNFVGINDEILNLPDRVCRRAGGVLENDDRPDSGW